MFNRMIRAAKLDVSLYEEVEHEPRATAEAMAVVVLVALATGIGSLAAGGGSGIFILVFWGVIGWALWASVTFVLGTTLFRTPETNATWGQLARTLGFAQSPGMLRIFAFIPIIGNIVLVVTFAWQLMAMVIAVRQALDYSSTWRAVGVLVAGFIPYAIVLYILASIIS